MLHNNEIDRWMAVAYMRQSVRLKTFLVQPVREGEPKWLDPNAWTSIEAADIGEASRQFACRNWPTGQKQFQVWAVANGGDDVHLITLEKEGA